MQARPLLRPLLYNAGKAPFIMQARPLLFTAPFTQHTVPYMLKHSDLFSELPDKFYDSAFLDRIHFYIPGWEVDIIRGEMFSDGYGFVVDYLAEILRSLRNHDYSDRYSEYFSLSADISTRDRDGILKTFSGLMKILFPHGGAAKEDVGMVLRFAIEG